MFKKIRLILISIILISCFVLPPNTSVVNASDNVNSYLKQGSIEDLMDIMRKEPLTQANFDLFFESIKGYDSNAPRKTGAVVLVKQVILKKQLDYWFKDMPEQLSIKFIKNTFAVVSIIYSNNVSKAIGIIEKLSITKATEYAINWLFQNKIKIGTGELNYSFSSYKGNWQNIKIQYIIAYHSLSQNKGEVVAEFYSKDPIEPPENRGSYGALANNVDWTTSTCWPRSYWIENERKRDNDGKIEPFILRIKGYVTEKDSPFFAMPGINDYPTYSRDKNEYNFSVEIDFDNLVPEIENSDFILANPPSETSFKKEIIKILLEKAKFGANSAKDFTLEKVNDVKNVTVNFFDEIKSLFSKLDFGADISEQIIMDQIDPWQMSSLEEPDSKLTLDLTKQEVLETQEKVEEVIQEILGPQDSENLEEERLASLERMREQLDYISKTLIEMKEKTEKLLAENEPEQEEEEEKKEEEKEVLACSIADTKHTSDKNKIIFNEIAWMGTKNSSNDEWIELKNISGSTIDMNNWQILDKAGLEDDTKGINIIFENATISQGGFFLLERTDDTSVPNIIADLIYTGALNNTNEALYLFDKNCNLQDKIEANPNWLAGDNSSKRTMERKTNFNWQTSSDPGGTPKAKNSSGYYEIPEEKISKSSTGSSSSVPDTAPEPSLMSKLLISEIQIESEKGANDEFIEIYNPNNTNVSLKWWSIQKATANGNISKKNFESEDVILAKGYFLIVNKYASQSLLSLADMKHYSFSLASDNTVFLVKNHDKIISGQENTISDKVGWGESFSPEGISALEPSTSQTIGRKWLEQNAEYQDTNNNYQDFEIQTPTLKARNQTFISEESLEEPLSPPKILISEIQTEGVTSRDEFIELFNPNDYEVNLSGFALKKKTSGGSESNLVSSTAFSGTIPGKGYFLIVPQVNEDGSENYQGKVLPDLRFSGKTYSFAANNTILFYSDNNELIDKIGFGEAQDFEEVSFPKNPETRDPFEEWLEEIGFKGWREGSHTLFYQSLGRKIDEKDGYQDTDNNAEDFEFQNPTPKAKNETFIEPNLEDILKDIDSIPPKVTIANPPINSANQTIIIFVFDADEENCAFQCQLDKGGWQECSSPKQYSELNDGEHIFEVKAFDLVGNISESATYSWTIDTSIESPILFLADSDSASTSTVFTNKPQVKVYITNDEEAVAWFLSEDSEKPATSTVGWLDIKPENFTLLSPNDGPKTVYVWTKDETNNTSSSSAFIILDTIAPQIFIDKSPDNPTNQATTTFVFFCNEKNCTFEYKLDSEDCQNCHESLQSQESVTLYGLSEEEHLFQVRAIDQAGNYSSSSDYSWLIDLTPPSSQVESLATSSTSTILTIKWSGSDPATGTNPVSGILNYDVQYTTSTGEWQDLVIATTSTSTEFTSEDEHTYYFRSIATDISGNEESRLKEFDTFCKIEVPKDKIPPEPISDLQAEAGINFGEIILSWTAPGNDGDVGQASEYIIKYGPEEITEDNWASSTIVENLPLPKPTGSEEIFIVSNLGDNTLYYFALKTKDESENLSQISNSPTAKTLNHIPVATFSYQPENPQQDQEIIFDATCSNDPDGTISFYVWDFGDGNSATTPLATTTHTFDTANQFQIILLVKDDEGTSSEPFNDVVIEVLEKPQANLIISEVQIRDQNSTYNDFIELFNPSAIDIDISGFQLEKKSSTGEEYSIRLLPDNSIIPAQSHFLWTNSDYVYLNELADATSTQTLARDNSIALLDENKNIIDAVAWGSSTDPFVENIPFSQNPAENQSLGRKTDIENNYIDTDDNSQDFELQGPTPTNSQEEQGDVIPPELVSDFQVASSIDNIVVLTWSATTDPDTATSNISYIVHWSRDGEITQDNLTTTSSTTATTTTITVSDLYYDSTYYFGIQAFDDLNYSDLAITSFSIPLPTITDLNTGTSAVRKAIDLFWTSSAIRWYSPSERNVLSATPTNYEIKYEEIIENNTNEYQINWEYAVLLENTLVPQKEGETEHFRVENLDPTKTYYFNIKSIGENGTVSEISNLSKSKAISGFVDNNNGTITDLYTGLMWIKDGNGSVSNNGTTSTWDETVSFINNLNSTTTGGFAGYNDWRLPNFKELASIIDYSKNSLVIDENYFPNTKSAKYWTSNKISLDVQAYTGGNPYRIYSVDFDDGYITYHDWGGGYTGSKPETPYYYVRLVRDLSTTSPSILSSTGLQGDPSTACNSGCTNNGNETITDNCTNLMWIEGGTKTLIGKSNTISWKNAFNLCNNLITAGYNDWRLPNIMEIINASNKIGSDILSWGNGSRGYYLSSTLVSDGIWEINNGVWKAGNGYSVGKVQVLLKSSSHYIQCVRE